MVVQPDPDNAACLLGHLASANPHAQAMLVSDSTLVLQGAHGYVSPAWYVSGLPLVPTWNYRVAHLTGRAEQVADEALDALLAQLVSRFEGKEGWRMTAVPEKALAAMRRGIVGFRFRPQRVEVKNKLSQNRLPEDVVGVMTALTQEGSPESLRLAAAMREALKPGRRGG